MSKRPRLGVLALAGAVGACQAGGAESEHIPDAGVAPDGTLGPPSGTGGLPGAGGDMPAMTGGAAGTGGTGAATGGTAGVSMDSGGTGAAGAPTTGGVAATGGMSATGGASTSNPCDAAWFCSSFEDGTVPSELAFFPEYLRDDSANYVAPDGSAVHAGAYSLKVQGTGFSQMLGIEVPSATFWARVYLRTNPESLDEHSTYVLATDGSGDPNEGEAVRVGEHKCQLEVNRRSDDAERLSNGGTYECAGGVQLAADTWYCLEVFYDGSGGEMRTFVDGAEVPELHVTDWGPYAYRLFKFGFESYHGASKTVWYDDVAVGPERFGCLP